MTNSFARRSGFASGAATCSATCSATFAAICAAIGAAILIAVPSFAQGTLEDSLPSGANYAVAQFRFWAPPGVAQVRAVLVLVPGSNGDGRAMAQDTVWQNFATKHNLAIIACRFTDKPHEQSFFEDYISVSQGTGQALLTSLSHFAERSKHRVERLTF